MEPLPPLISKRLSKFRTYQKVKQATLTYLATQLSENEAHSLRMYFLNLDKNGDGILSSEEVVEGIKKSTTNADLKGVFEALDTNESGFVDYNGTMLIVRE